MQGFVRHFAAGVVFAAGAAELLPDIVHGGSFGATLVGATIGVALMLAIRYASRKAQGPASLTAVIGIDQLVDGLVVSLGFTAGQNQGLLLTIALTIEFLFLGLTVSSEFAEAKTSKMFIVAITVGLALLLPTGAAIGASVFGRLSRPLLTALFTFGLVALLYLVTEELLVEVHERPETPLNASMFFYRLLFDGPAR